MTEGEIQYTRSGEYHIAYRVAGEGSGGVDVLYVGAYVFSLALRHPPSVRVLRETLAALGRLISFDGRGMGLSDRLRDHRLPPLEERMDDARAVLDATGAERALLVAGADGGPLACLLAATYPERTLGVVLMNTAPRFAWAPDYPWGVSREELERTLEEMEQGWARGRTPSVTSQPSVRAASERRLSRVMRDERRRAASSSAARSNPK